jgi:hypothetical protein
MRRPTSKPSDIDRFLTTVSPERKIVLFHNKQIIFSQGVRGDSVFHIEDGSEAHRNIRAGQGGNRWYSRKRRLVRLKLYRVRSTRPISVAQLRPSEFKDLACPTTGPNAKLARFAQLSPALSRFYASSFDPKILLVSSR